MHSAPEITFRLEISIRKKKKKWKFPDKTLFQQISLKNFKNYRAILENHKKFRLYTKYLSFN